MNLAFSEDLERRLMPFPLRLLASRHLRRLTCPPVVGGVEYENAANDTVSD